MMIWTITMTGVAAIFWAVSIAARMEISRLRKAMPPNTSEDKEDLVKCIEALIEIRGIELPTFADCAGRKTQGQDSAWSTTKLLCVACVTARSTLRELTTPVECEFCDNGYVACPSPDCFGGNTREGGYCPLCRGSGAIQCEDCNGKGEC